MADTTEQKELKKLFRLHYLLYFLLSWIGPLIYFSVTTGITQQVTKLFMPILLVSFFGIIRLGSDINSWTELWPPSFKKGIIKGIPKILLFILLITLGLMLKYMLERTINVAFGTYFESVLVIFGGQAAGAVFRAYYEKYLGKYKLSIGFVLGVVNK